MKCTLIAFILLPILVFAGGGDDHTHGNETKKGNETEVGYLSAEAYSDKFEVLIKYNQLQPQKESKFQLFLSDYSSNKPVDSAIVKINVKGNNKLLFSVNSVGVGTYEVAGIFEKTDTCDLLIQIESKTGNDLILVKGIMVGKQIEHDKEKQHGSNDIIWLYFIGGLILGVLLMFVFNRIWKKRINATFFLLLVLFSIFPQPSSVIAHEGHGDSGKTKELPAGAQFIVPKETQFLFDVQTSKAERGKYEATTTLFGTIIPSSNGQAIVTVPQSGKITKLNVVVGQKVTQGDVLAIVEQAIDAGNQIVLLAEKNNINAEFEIVKKEYERLKQIEDVISKKELVSAEENYKKAKENKELFNSSNGKTLVLRSPIDGVLGNFTYTVGSTVDVNTPIFTVTNLSTVFVEAQVFDKDAEKVKAGERFMVECTNDDHKTAQVNLIALAQSINPTNQSQRVLFQMENKDEGFKIGEFVNIRVHSKKELTKMVLPNSAISEINGRPVVFIKDKAEQYSISYISTGENNGEYTVINKGIEEGERVVINGTYQMKMIYLNQ